MSADKHPLSQEEFDSIYAKVPRLTVEVILKNTNGIYLTKRSIEPCKGQWHLPGGTVRFGESLIEAVQRTAKRELGIVVKTAKEMGVIEYPSHYLQGLDQPVGVVYEVQTYSGEPIINNEAQEAGWFKSLPNPMHAEQDTFLINNNYVSE